MTDQLIVLKYLVDTFKFIDKTRICVVGTGYGGYVAAMMLAKDALGIVNCSVSLAPITSWLFYSEYRVNNQQSQQRPLLLSRINTSFVARVVNFNAFNCIFAANLCVFTSCLGDF